MSDRSPFPSCSQPFPGNGQQKRSPVPLPIRGNGYGNADGSLSSAPAFPSENASRASCRPEGPGPIAVIPATTRPVDDALVNTDRQQHGTDDPAIARVRAVGQQEADRHPCADADDPLHHAATVSGDRSRPSNESSRETRPLNTQGAGVTGWPPGPRVREEKRAEGQTFSRSPNTGQACRLCCQPLLIPIPGGDICEMCRAERRPS